MKHQFLRLALPASAMLMLTGCVDNDYDLSDIDTTSEIKVNDLTLPLNLAAIRLDEVVDLADNDLIEIYEENGEKFYALTKSGSIQTDPILIRAIRATAPVIPSVSAPVSTDVNAARSADVNFSLPALSQTFSYQARSIDPSVLSLTKVTVSPMVFTIRLSMEYVGNGLSGTVSNLRFQFPKGLTATADTGEYDPATGILTVQRATLTEGQELTVRLTATAVDLSANGAALSGGSMDFNGTLGLLSGATLAIDTDALSMAETLPRISLGFTLGDFEVKSFSGRIDYSVGGVDIAPIALSGLPDFLNNPNTSLIPADPQLYLNIDNTTAPYGTDAKASAIRLNSHFSSGYVRTEKSDGFSLGNVKGQTAYNLLFAPQASVVSIPPSLAQYADPAPVRVDFTGMGEILYLPGHKDGLPASIGVGIENLSVTGAAGGEITDFPVGSQIPGISGEYTFFAPLSFAQGTVIVYQKTDNGWDSDDLKDLNINTVRITATASTSIPVDLDLSVSLVDAAGNVLGSTESFHLPANSNMESVSLTMTTSPGSPIRGIDGVRYTAVVTQPNSDSYPIGPDLTIDLSDLRITVNGAYIHEF